MKILIVDDNTQNLYLLQTLLSGHGYRVAEAANGVEALEKARSERPDMIISDILMPVMDGFELCRQWKRDGALKDVPFVFYTATYTDIKDEKFALGLGAERFVIKPQEPDVLLGILKEVFEAHKAGGFAAPREPQHDETVFFKEYNEALFRKLEKKMVQVEETNRRLEREIAERIRTEEALVASEVRYRRLFEAAKDGILILDAETGTVVDVNPFLIKLLGYSREQFIGKRLWEMGFFKDIIANQDNFLQLQRKEYIRYEDLPLETADGRRIEVEFVSNVYLVGDQKVIQCNIRDVSERKRVEEDLARAAKGWQTTFDATNNVMWILDKNNRVLRSNRAAEQFFRRPLEELIGKHCWEITHGTEQPVPDCPVLRAKNSLRRETLELHLGKVWIEIMVDPILDAVGLYNGAVHIISDVTERRELEEQLHQAMKMEAIGRLAGGVAHDFNNALTPIMVICGILLKELNHDQPIYEDLQDIKEMGERCVSLTRQLLAFSRSQTLELTVFNLNDVVVNMVKMLSRVIGEDIELSKFLDPELGNVKADVGQIEQIIVNLAVNARDAMPDGGKLTIETTNVVLDEEYANNHVAVTPGPHVMLAISDTGVGMDEETKEHIFEPFFTTKEKGKGTGLGLSTVYGIVKQCGGNIWLYSELGRGTIFKIYLPCVEEKAKKLDSLGLAPAKSYRGSETILLVEDEDSVRKVAKRILVGQGYKILDACDAEQALKISESYKEPIHIVITDVVMPGMNGKEMADLLTSSRPETKVLFVSGYTDNTVVQHGVLDKGINFIQKPFTVESLSAKVRAVLDK